MTLNGKSIKFTKILILTMLGIFTFSVLVFYLIAGWDRSIHAQSIGQGQSAQGYTYTYQQEGSSSWIDVAASNSRLDESYLYRKSSYILELSNNTHARVTNLNAGATPAIVVYYATWCPHCKHFVPTYESIVQSAKEKSIDVTSVHFTALNCVNFRDICKDMKITSYPTVRTFNFQDTKSNLRASDSGSDKTGIKDNNAANLGVTIKHTSDIILKYLMDRKASLSTLKSSANPSDGSQSQALDPKGANVEAVTLFIENTKHAKSKYTSASVRLNDALSALHFMIGDESVGSITAKKLDAVIVLLGVVSKLLPQNLEMPYSSLHRKLSILQNKYATRLNQGDTKAAAEFLRTEFSATIDQFALNNKREFQVCGKTATSSPGEALSHDVAKNIEASGDGYTCGVWMLFHYITVAGLFQSEEPRDIPAVNAAQVLQTIRLSVDQLFGCTDCRDHFIKSFDSCEHGNCRVTSRLATEAGFEQAAVWLWRMHNAVTERVFRETIARNRAEDHFEVDKNKLDVSKFEILWPLSSSSSSISDTNDKEIVLLLKKYYFDDQQWILSHRKPQGGKNDAENSNIARILRSDLKPELELSNVYETYEGYNLFTSPAVSRSSLIILFFVVVFSMLLSMFYCFSMFQNGKLLEILQTEGIRRDKSQSHLL